MACRYFKIKESELSGLEGKVAIVTGASSGIGLATAKLLVRLNAGAVFLLDLQGPKEDLGPRASFIETNVTSWESLRGAFDIVMARCGRIDIVHANAGIADTTDYVNLSEENGQLLEPSRYPYDVNLFGCFNTVSLAIHHMQKQSPQGGSIIMTASGAGYEGVTSAAYSELNYSCFLNCGLFTEELIIEAAGKHGIIGFLRAMKLQLYPKLPIRLNVVAPGFTESAITASALSTFKAVGLIIQPASAIALAVAPKIDIVDQVHSKPDHIKIIHVGAGASGLLMAYKARKMLKNFDLILYEKNPVIGGTWWENRYPGCACDIPAHCYTYSFEPNTEWSEFYSGHSEIQEYFVRFYEKHQLEPFVRLNHKVISTVWDDDQCIWNVEIEHDGQIVHDWCHVLVNGAGVVNRWKWPVIEGLHDFQGKLAHSAAWDETINTEGKKVAVIGTGSSSIQMVPHLAKGAEHLTVFMRNQFWISPQIPTDEQKLETSDRKAIIGRHYYTEDEKKAFRENEDFHLAYRKELESKMGKKFPVFMRGTPDNEMAKKVFRADMAKKIGPGHEELLEKMIPTWSPGCRRMTPGEGYLETLAQPHVSTVHEEIVKITPTGLVTASGQEVNVDIIACGTGFETSYVPHFKIVGMGGVVMQEEWKEESNIYCSISGPNYPNYWVINGPRGNWGQGCALPSHEVQIEYVVQCVDKMQREKIKSLEVKQKPTTDFNNHLDAWHKKHSVWAEDCRSWYKKNKKDGRVYIWGGSLLHLLKTLRTPRFEHYEIRYKNEDDTWAFLGNGLTEADVIGTVEKLTPFIRNSDVPWVID
ncbi:hypothetical protein B0A52_03394 [Exophiala mesophila]|uniref:FAD/NAD(P)-binding domain-containing protein n=1 Tax=Exophiala mesophila TaxID=212818 RepID=A0A438N5J8_EXOME|nr:hypothetical protein B0A52_03394 [Exophiala mesophila]